MTGLISSKTHGVLDYVSGALITFSPWIFGFVNVGGAALFIPVFIGSISLFMTMFTNNYWGMVKMIQLQFNMVVDMFVGVTLILSPFVYHFYHLVVWPHVLLGLLALCEGMFSQFSPFLNNKLREFDERGY